MKHNIPTKKRNQLQAEFNQLVIYIKKIKYHLKPITIYHVAKFYLSKMYNNYLNFNTIETNTLGN